MIIVCLFYSLSYSVEELTIITLFKWEQGLFIGRLAGVSPMGTWRVMLHASSSASQIFSRRDWTILLAQKNTPPNGFSKW